MNEGNWYGQLETSNEAHELPLYFSDSPYFSPLGAEEKSSRVVVG